MMIYTRFYIIKTIIDYNIIIILICVVLWNIYQVYYVFFTCRSWPTLCVFCFLGQDGCMTEILVFGSTLLR